MPYHRSVYLCWFPVPWEPNHPCPTDTPVTIGKQEIISYKHKSGGTCYHIDSMCIYNRLPLSRACWEPKFASVNYVVLPLSRAFGRRPRLATFWSKDPHWRLQLPNSMLSDNRRTYVSGISAHIDIALATDHNKQYHILLLMQQNCQITRCVRQHTMDSVLKSAKPCRCLTGHESHFK